MYFWKYTCMLNVSTCIPPTPKSPDVLLYLYQDYNERVRRRCLLTWICMWQLDKAFCIYGYVHTDSKDCLHQQKFKFKNCPEFQFFTAWITSRVFFWNDRWHKAHEYWYTALLLGLNNDTVIIDKKLGIDLVTKYIHPL